LIWFGSHSPTWLESLLRPSGIHNHLSQHHFSPLELLFLSHGLNFIPSPPPSRLLKLQQQPLNDTECGWIRFQRYLLKQLHHRDPSADGESSRQHDPRFAIPTTRRANIAFLREQLLLNDSPAVGFYDLYVKATQPALQQILSEPTLLNRIKRLRRNLSSLDEHFVRRLMNDASITIKPADKNLGMVLVDTDWYDRELKHMLADTNTYQALTIGRERSATTLMSVGSPAYMSLLEKMHESIKRIAKDYGSLLHSQFSSTSSQMLRYLTERVIPRTAVLPSIYLLIKVHKPSGLCGRPIVPSTNWMTTPASVLVDRLLQDILQKAHIPWLIRDTKSFVNELESLKMSSTTGRFLTADVASLYTNIDTDMGLKLVEEFLAWQKVPMPLADLIMKLLSFVMHNSYLTYRGVIYRQINGTAMGTTAAPVYANIVVIMLERRVLESMRDTIFVYRRFLDDVFAYVCPTVSTQLRVELNSLHPRLQFDFTQHDYEASFLDLVIYKGRRFHSTYIFDLRVHQKKMNLYLYIPYTSLHTDAAKAAFIQTELIRYIRNSSDIEAYIELKRRFYTRLRDRGYPTRFLIPHFNSIYYCDRPFFLAQSSDLLTHPLLQHRQPLSACLQRKLERLHMNAKSPSLTSHGVRPVFVIPYSPITREVNIRPILLRHWERIQATISLPQPIIAYQSMPSLIKRLVYSKAKREEEERQRRARSTSIPQSTQTTLTSYLRTR
jgi:hypothetical protein